MTKRGKRGQFRMGVAEFPMVERYTVSGHCVGDICFRCECRVVQFSGEDAIMLAWCSCDFPDDHHEMEIL